MVGSGGREHALVRVLAATGWTVFAAPGNPGIAADADVRDIPMSDHAALVALATGEAVDLVVVGPEAPLVAGPTDDLRAAGVAVLGPSKAAAQLEGSKAFAKEIMLAAGVPTGRSETVTSVDEGMAAVAEFGLPVAVKADGLAAGKGVVIAHSDAEAREALAVGRGQFQQALGRCGSLHGAGHHGIGEELQPGLPIARQAHRIQQLVVGLPVFLEVQAQVQHRFAHQAIDRELQRDKQATHPTIAVEERVDGLELHVGQRRLDQR